MKSKRRLLAAVTASGAVLCLSVSSDSYAHVPAIEPSANPYPELLSLRVEQLKEKLRTISPNPEGTTNGKIKNIVQFFNFYNCMRGAWRNC
jgi:hypothetical protein